MQALLAALGGRKMFLVVIVMIVIALKNVLKLDNETINMLVYLALGGSGAIALDDIGKSYAESKKVNPTTVETTTTTSPTIEGPPATTVATTTTTTQPPEGPSTTDDARM